MGMYENPPYYLSAYALAVKRGFKGTEDEWLKSLQGPEGKPGGDAYQVAVSQGFEGTEAQWLESLRGPEGPQGKPLYVSLDVDVKTGGWSSDRTYDEILNKHKAQQEIICILAQNGGEDLELRLIQATPAALIFGAVLAGVEWRAVIRPGDEEFAAAEVTVTDYRSKSRATDEIYFDITDDGVISLKPEYRGACPVDPNQSAEAVAYANAVSDNGKNRAGSQNKELPEEIVIPETVNGIPVTAYAYAMFIRNNRIKRLVLHPGIKEIPSYMFYGTWNLQEVVGTEIVETLNSYAFAQSGILAAKFPALKTISGFAHFRRCTEMVVADLGNTITEIPKQCFEGCEKLVEIRNAQAVTKINANGFAYTLRLKKLPFLPNVAEIGNYGLLISRVNVEQVSPGCTVGNRSTAKAFYGEEYWSACNFTPCNTPLRSTFHQDDPRWVDKKIGNTERTWDKGCLLTCAAMAYSILENKDLSSPEEFTDAVYAADPTLKDVDTGLYGIQAIERYFAAVGYTATEYRPFTTANLQALYDALADGALVINRCLADASDGNHDVLIHGINADGEVLCADPSSLAQALEKYDAITYAMPIQNRNRAAEGTDKDFFWIVRKN